MLYLFDGLICTDVEVHFEGQMKLLKNVVIDTGAVQSILNHSFVIDIGINPKFVDEFRMTYGIGGEMAYFCRKIDKIKIGDFEFADFDIDFGDIDPNGEIQGLIGLDVLKSMRAVIDIEIPELLCKK